MRISPRLCCARCVCCSVTPRFPIPCDALRGCCPRPVVTTMARRLKVKGSATRRPAKAPSLHGTDDCELILRSIGEGVHVVDASGHVTFVNPSGSQMLGYAAEEL